MPAEQPPEIAPPSPVISSEDGAQATREEVLAEYWGDRWPEIREALIKEGKDLSLPLHLVPWEESAPKLYEGMIDFSDEDLAMWKGHFYRWPAELTADWLVENQYISQADALTPVQIQELSDLAATLNVDIEWRVDEFLFELEAAMKSKWDSGNFEKAPVSTAGLPQAPDAFHSSASVSGSWTARVNLTRSEDPELYAKQEEIRAIVRKRTQTLRSWIRRQLEEH